MLVCKKSSFSLSFVIAWGFFATGAWGQQRENDFTKKMRSFDGRLSNLSGKRLSSSRMNSAFSKRISVREWPSKYSSFGTRRVPLGDSKTIGSERVPTTRLQVKTPLNDSLARANWERVSQNDLGESAQAVSSVQFRDAYYAELGKRVDDWMEKVNNMSLRDVNRFQFRRHRPSEPGFPVQQAGSENLPSPPPDGGFGRPSLRGVTPPGSSSKVPKQSYWLGPKKIRTSAPRPKAPTDRVFQSAPQPPDKNFKYYPKPLFGPKKIRVEVK